MDEFVWVTLSDEYGDAGVYCGIWICENISFDEDSIIQNASELSRLDDQPQKHGYQGKYYPPPPACLCGSFLNLIEYLMKA